MPTGSIKGGRLGDLVLTGGDTCQMVFRGRHYPYTRLIGYTQTMLDEFERCLVYAKDETHWQDGDTNNVRLIMWCRDKALAAQEGRVDETPIPPLKEPLKLYGCLLL